jgi:hypothetical protein
MYDAQVAMFIDKQAKDPYYCVLDHTSLGFACVKAQKA